MSFEELLDEACKSANRPNMVRMQLPHALSEQMKKRLLKLNPEEFGCILSSAIDAVDHGFIKSIDAMARKMIQMRKSSILNKQIWRNK